jgi:hypothetical protein
VTAPTFVPERNHLISDALHRLADLYAADRVEELPRMLQVRATDEGMVADLLAGMDHVVDGEDDDGVAYWCGQLLGREAYVWVDPPKPSMAELAAAILTPDATLTPDGVTS